MALKAVALGDRLQEVLVNGWTLRRSGGGSRLNLFPRLDTQSCRRGECQLDCMCTATQVFFTCMAPDPAPQGKTHFISYSLSTCCVLLLLVLLLVLCCRLVVPGLLLVACGPISWPHPPRCAMHGASYNIGLSLECRQSW